MGYGNPNPYRYTMWAQRICPMDQCNISNRPLNKLLRVLHTKGSHHREGYEPSVWFLPLKRANQESRLLQNHLLCLVHPASIILSTSWIPPQWNRMDFQLWALPTGNDTLSKNTIVPPVQIKKKKKQRLYRFRWPETCGINSWLYHINRTISIKWKRICMY